MFLSIGQDMIYTFLKKLQLQFDYLKGQNN